MSALELCTRIEVAKKVNFEFDRYLRLLADLETLQDQIKRDQAAATRIIQRLEEIKHRLPRELQELV